MEELKLQSEVAEDEEVIAELSLCYVDNNVLNEGLCSCVCISHEKCCGCLLQ